MIRFSKALESTLHRSLEFAELRSQKWATLEHLLLALIEDKDAAKVLHACNVDLAKLQVRLTDYLEDEVHELKDDGSASQPTTGFQRVIHRAVVHVRSAGKEEVTGANALVAIFAERESPAVLFLEEQEVTRLDAIQYISHGIAKPPATPSLSKRPVSDAAETLRPIQTPVARKIFISYRRDDSSGHTGRVHDRLEREFGKDLLFMDVEAIPLGVNFVVAIKDEVAKCDAMLAVIGPDWLVASDDYGQRRLDKTEDFVRLEISAALQRDIPVIPILVGGARMPPIESLPEQIKELALRNRLEIRHTSFHADMDKLVDRLRQRLGR